MKKIVLLALVVFGFLTINVFSADVVVDPPKVLTNNLSGFNVVLIELDQVTGTWTVWVQGVITNVPRASIEGLTVTQIIEINAKSVLTRQDIATYMGVPSVDVLTVAQLRIAITGLSRQRVFNYFGIPL